MKRNSHGYSLSAFAGFFTCVAGYFADCLEKFTSRFVSLLYCCRNNTRRSFKSQRQILGPDVEKSLEPPKKERTMIKKFRQSQKHRVYLNKRKQLGHTNPRRNVQSGPVATDLFTASQNVFT